MGRHPHPGRPPDRPLRTHSEARPRLLRAKPRRRRHLAAHERHRGARERCRRRADHARPEHDRARRLGGRPAVCELEARHRDADRVPRHGDRHGDLPVLLEPGLPPDTAPPGGGHRAAPGGHLGRARRPGLPARGHQLRALRRDQRPLPRGQRPDGDRLGDLLPVRRPALGARDGRGARLRRHARVPGRPHTGRPLRVHRAPVELLRPGAAALAVLPDVPGGDGRARQHLHRARHGAGDDRRGRRPRAAADPGRGGVRRRPLRLRPGRDRGAARRLVRGPRRAGRSPSSGTRARASRRS